MNYQEFAKRVKTKYPEYMDMDDLSLAKAMVTKFPEDYKDITFDGAPAGQPKGGPSSSSSYVPSASSSAPRVEKEKISPQAREEATGFWKSQLFPESAEAFVRGDNGLDRALAGVSDVATLPGRFYIGSTDDMGYTPDEAVGFRQRIASDRTLLPLLGVGALGLPFKAGGAVAKFGAPARVLATTGVGAAEGAGGSVASDLAAGRDVSGTGAALGAGLGGLLTAPFAAARQSRIGDLPPDVGELAYNAGVHRKAAGAKGIDDASEKVLRYAKDVDKPHADVLEKAQDQITDALFGAEQRMKELRRSNRITADEFKKGTEGRQAVIDNLTAEGTWLTPEALMREARRVRSADPDLAQSLEDIAVDRLWQATSGRALTAAGGFRFGFETPLEDVGAAQDALFVKALDQTKHLPAPKALLDAQKSGAAASALYKGLPGGKPAVAGQIIEKWTGIPFMTPASGPLVVPFSRKEPSNRD